MERHQPMYKVSDPSTAGASIPRFTWLFLVAMSASRQRKGPKEGSSGNSLEGSCYGRGIRTILYNCSRLLCSQTNNRQAQDGWTGPDALTLPAEIQALMQ